MEVIEEEVKVASSPQFAGDFLSLLQVKKEKKEKENKIYKTKRLM